MLPPPMHDRVQIHLRDGSAAVFRLLLRVDLLLRVMMTRRRRGEIRHGHRPGYLRVLLVVSDAVCWTR